MGFLKRAQILKYAPWVGEDWVRPYVYSRRDNAIARPGGVFEIDWFQQEPLILDPFSMADVKYADQILRVESKAFASVDMVTPRWVFYDCGLMPGFVFGFCVRRDKMTATMKKNLEVPEDLEWVPVSLFIIIPAVAEGEWVAHNLSSANALVPKEERLYGLGFLTKAFGLWYGNIKNCCGMTQWTSPALRLHSHYGDFEVVTAYTPVHTHAMTLTYRCRIRPSYWAAFFQQTSLDDVSRKFNDSGFMVEPKNEESLKSFQRRLEHKEGPFFLNSKEIRQVELGSPLKVYLK